MPVVSVSVQQGLPVFREQVFYAVSEYSRRYSEASPVYDVCYCEYIVKDCLNTESSVLLIICYGSAPRLTIPDRRKLSLCVVLCLKHTKQITHYELLQLLWQELFIIKKTDRGTACRDGTRRCPCCFGILLYKTVIYLNKNLLREDTVLT